MMQICRQIEVEKVFKTLTTAQNSVIKLWICRYCGIISNSLSGYGYVMWFIFTWDNYCCLTLSSVTHGVMVFVNVQ